MNKDIKLIFLCCKYMSKYVLYFYMFDDWYSYLRFRTMPNYFSFELKILEDMKK